MLAEYSGDALTIVEIALYKRVTDHWRRTRQPVKARVLADLVGWDDGQVRAVLRRMEAKGVVMRQGQRGGWLPARGREAGRSAMGKRKPDQAKGAERRQRIYEFVVAYADEMDGPTPNAREISKALNIPYKVTRYHLTKLIAMGLLRSERNKLIVVDSEWLRPPAQAGRRQMEFDF